MVKFVSVFGLLPAPHPTSSDSAAKNIGTPINLLTMHLSSKNRHMTDLSQFAGLLD
jgi:hypothetical protein